MEREEEERVEREYGLEGEGVGKEEKGKGGRSTRRGSREEDRERGKKKTRKSEGRESKATNNIFSKVFF